MRLNNFRFPCIKVNVPLPTRIRKVLKVWCKLRLLPIIQNLITLTEESDIIDVHNNVTDKIIHKIIISSKQMLRKEHGRTAILIEQSCSINIDRYVRIA